MYNIELQWKEHNIDLSAWNFWAKEQDENCCGCSADSKLTVHFTKEPSQKVKDAIEQKWADMDDSEHEMCQSYKSQAELNTERQAASDSAKAKLIAALGLTKEELVALLG